MACFHHYNSYEGGHRKTPEKYQWGQLPNTFPQGEFIDEIIIQNNELITQRCVMENDCKGIGNISKQTQSSSQRLVVKIPASSANAAFCIQLEQF